MRVTSFLAAAAIVGLGAFCVVADDPAKGIPARPSASDYAARAQWQHATFAASLVPAKQAQHLFAFDISRSYLIFEVACYADDKASLKISRDAFVVKVNASGDSIHNADATTVASTIQRQNAPPMPSAHSGNIETAASIGYSHGTDPYTGRPVSGVYTSGGVAAESGDRRDMPPPDTSSKPGGTYEDRKMLEAQLRVRGLPDGPVDHAVAGYLFFRKSDVKAQPDDTYALQYLADDDGSGATHAVTISVPKKSK